MYRKLATTITKEMPQASSTSITRRSAVAALALAASPVALAGSNSAYAETDQTPEKSLYERLGGVFAIAAVVNHFSDAVVKNPVVGQKSQESAAAGMAHQEPGKAARPQVHADAVGLRRFGWTLQIHGYQARQDTSWP